VKAVSLSRDGLDKAGHARVVSQLAAQVEDVPIDEVAPDVGIDLRGRKAN